mmetsp:Transcript_34911/g.58415  ORF Transcript_34911/g.58415 Transcript_34911/m.58415 type:complete len:389 (+) Transcript_34911:1113-2279(+)
MVGGSQLRDVPAHLAVRVAERHPLLADQLVGLIRGVQVGGQRRFDVGPHGLQRAHRLRHDRQAPLDDLHPLDGDRLGVLDVAVVPGDEADVHGRQPGPEAQEAGGAPAHQLEQVPVLLLGHDGGPRRVPGGDGEELALAGGEEDHVRGEAAQVVDDGGQGVQHAALDLAPGVGVRHRDAHGPFKSEKPRRPLTVQREPNAVSRATPQGAVVRQAVGGVQHDRVLHQSGRVRPKKLPHAGRHAPLHVGVARQGVELVPLRLLAEGVRSLESGQRHVNELVLLPQADGGHDLVVAAPACVQPLAGLPQPLDQQALHFAVDVLVGLLHRPHLLVVLLVEGLQPFHERALVLRGDQAAFAQHRGVRNGAQDVVGGDLPVEKVVVAHRKLVDK